MSASSFAGSGTEASNGTGIWQFIWPDPEQPIQLFFFFLILALATSAVVWARMTANKESWSRRWQGGLNYEHGSIHDLSNAAATPAERVCEILPGVLLILGLLGTFIGLGIALDHAAGVFRGDPGTMQGELSAVINGIGTKFRTSAWGIIAFLVLRLIIAAMGWNDKRLRWCIRKVNEEAKAQRDKDLRSLSDLNNNLRTEVRTGAQGVSRATAAELKAVMANLLPVFQKIERHGDTAQQALSEFVRTHVESMQSIAESAEGMKAASTTMSAAAATVNSSATDLRTVVIDFGSNVSNTLDNLQSELIGTIGTMDQSFDRNLNAMSGKIAASTEEISSTMASLGETVGTAMGDVKAVVSKVSSTINETVKMQVESLANFQSAAVQLNENALHMVTPIRALEEMLADKFAGIGRTGLEVASLSKKTLEMAKHHEKVARSLDTLTGKLDGVDWCTGKDLHRIETTMMTCNETLMTFLARAAEEANAADILAPDDGADREG